MDSFQITAVDDQRFSTQSEKNFYDKQVNFSRSSHTLTVALLLLSAVAGALILHFFVFLFVAKISNSGIALTVSWVSLLVLVALGGKIARTKTPK
jgi:membrane protein YdbS with pleckstrin-like domain